MNSNAKTTKSGENKATIRTNELDTPLGASQLLRRTEERRQELNLHHETELIKNLVMSNQVMTRGKEEDKIDKIEHYQNLSQQLADWIVTNANPKIQAAADRGHGWTNIYQYLPTNHPEGVATVIPTLYTDVNCDQTLLKYFTGIDDSGNLIKSTKANNGVPIILLIQGPKVGSQRSLQGLRAQGLKPIIDIMSEKFSSLYPGVKLIHRWVGKNGYIIEAVWDLNGYKDRETARSISRPSQNSASAPFVACHSFTNEKNTSSERQIQRI